MTQTCAAAPREGCPAPLLLPGHTACGTWASVRGWTAPCSREHASTAAGPVRLDGHRVKCVEAEADQARLVASEAHARAGDAERARKALQEEAEAMHKQKVGGAG